jgi:hypothetical protein
MRALTPTKNGVTSVLMLSRTGCSITKPICKSMPPNSFPLATYLVVVLPQALMSAPPFTAKAIPSSSPCTEATRASPSQAAVPPLQSNVAI